MPELACHCGSLRVAVDLDRSGTHVTCYCDDCRAYLRWLERGDLLDAHGGTEIVQLAPRQLRLLSGGERLACLRLSERGLHRFFASCCRTPLGNALPRVPFVGIVVRGIGLALPSKPVGIHGRFALGDGHGAHAIAPLSLLVRSAITIGGRWLLGRGGASPFFDDAGSSRAAVRVLTPQERAAIADR